MADKQNKKQLDRDIGKVWLANQSKLDLKTMEADKTEVDKKEVIKKTYLASLNHQVGQQREEETMDSNEWNLNKGYLAKIAE